MIKNKVFIYNKCILIKVKKCYKKKNKGTYKNCYIKRVYFLLASFKSHRHSIGVLSKKENITTEVCKTNKMHRE